MAPPNGSEINERTKLILATTTAAGAAAAGHPSTPLSPNYQNTNSSRGSAGGGGLSGLFDDPSETTDSNDFLDHEKQLTIPNIQHNDDDNENAKQNLIQRWCFRPCDGDANSAAIGAVTCQDMKSFVTGSIVFLLYHVVFCLAQASTITRPHSDHSSTCVMAKLAALGVFTAGPLFVFELGSTVPAIYPASDLFLAPFLAQLATTIDDVLYEKGLQNNDAVFLATFGTIMGSGFIVSGLLCILAARVKLANLGAFLPYSVLCGFFTTIGILIWTLGFSVDVGKKVGEVIKSGNGAVIANALLHHAPSLIIGIVMHVLGPKNPLLVILLVICTIFGSYGLLWITGTTLQQAQEWNWFFSAKDFQETPAFSDTFYGPSAPFGVWILALNGYVCWDACLAAIPTMISLVFLYLVRCSLHSAALKKNIPNVTREKIEEFHSPERRLSSISMVPTKGREQGAANKNKKQQASLDFILEHGYGYTQITSGLAGGITVAPSVAASLTLFKLGAESNPPQYGSCLLVLIFYFSNFSLVQYIPKPAFSCLMVLAGLDMCRTWIFDSYFKTNSKMEWMVGPLLVVLAFSIGVLNAIFCGIACSTFIFVAKFYHVGAVKYVGSGLTLRSTVERGLREAHWLDQNGDLIQILVVQNYLFFGNSQSLLTYITTMFEESDEQTWADLPPLPKYLVVEFTLVTGMDTSAVDNIREIVRICQTHRCKLFLAGLNPALKSSLLYAGIKSAGTTAGGHKYLAYTADMETALAKAEDSLLSTVFHLEEKNETESSKRRRERRMSETEDDGFLYALRKIDEQHGLHLAEDLKGFQPYAEAIDLEPGDILVRDNDRGLYFVEAGLMRVQWAPGNTTRNFINSTLKGPHSQPGVGDGPSDNETSIGHMNARSRTIGREAAIWKQSHTSADHHIAAQSFRLARIGQGWVIGGIEAANGMKKPGVHVAITSCRLHHLPGCAISQSEQENPKLAMSLYKLISYLATKRQEMTIGQLGQQMRILNNPVPRLHGRGKAALAQLQNSEYPF